MKHFLKYLQTYVNFDVSFFDPLKIKSENLNILILLTFPPLKIALEVTNSADPDQTAPKGAV